MARGARRQRHGPRLHGSARRSVRCDRPRVMACPLQSGRRRHHHRLPRRGDEREAGHGIFCDGPPASWSAPIRMCRPPICACCRAARLHERRRHGRRFRFGDRHGEGRAAAAFHPQNFLGAVRAGDGPATLCAVAVETERAGLRRGFAPVRLGGRLEQAKPSFWLEFRRAALIKPPLSMHPIARARAAR